MKWLCGIGFEADERGPLEMAGWMADHGLGEVRALTVVHDAAVWGLPSELHQDLLGTGRADVRDRIGASAAAGKMASHEVVLGAAPHTVLCQRARETRSNIIIGRRARKQDDRLVRLGRVTRRVLRELPGSVCVTPADLSANGIGDGPILVAMGAEESSVGAVLFGQELARQLDRPVRYVHAVDDFPARLGALHAPATESVRATRRDHAKDRLGTFGELHGFGELPVVIASGAPIEVTLQTADELGASLLVCGSRRLTMEQRIFSMSFGSTLAALAPKPVFVVPPA